MFTMVLVDRNTRYEERLSFALALNAIIFALNYEHYAEIEIREGDFTSPIHRHQGHIFWPNT